MKKATRLFLKQRPNTQYVIVEEVKLDEALTNHCYQNAVKFAKTNEADFIVVSGWLIGDYFYELGTPLIPHYWVCDKKINKYYDPTPKHKDNTQNFDYVEDFDIFKYGNEQDYLPLSLKLLDDGRWQARNENGTGYVDLEKLDVEQLYKLRK